MPGEHRKHTPIVSESQQRLFGFWKSHPESKPASISEKQVTTHLKESKGKDLPESTSWVGKLKKKVHKELHRGK